MSQFAKLVGTKYLDVLLRPLIRSTAMMGHEIVDFVEFDPNSKRSPSTSNPNSGRRANTSKEEEVLKEKKN